MDRRAFLAGTGCGVVVLSAGCVTGTPLSPDVTASETRSYDVDDGAALSVRNRNGPVTVEGDARDDVRLEVEKSARTRAALEAAAVTAADADDGLRIETTVDESDEDSRATVSLSIACPDSVRLETAATTHGAVEVRDVTGDATVESRNGAITVADVAGVVSLSTANGAVEATGIDGIGDVTASNGAIDVEVPALAGDTDVRTNNGAIEAALSSALDATVTAETTNGAVEVEGPAFSSSETSRTTFSGTLGDGTHKLGLETTNGAVSITSLSG